MSIEQYVIEIIEGRKKPIGFSFLFSLGAWCFEACVQIRHWLFDKGWFSSYHAQAYVISVGNIVVGGVGKTPLIAKLANELEEKQVAIITRGYRSKIERSGESKQIAEPQKILTSVEECGDEPFWLAHKTNASVFVGKKKKISAQMAVKNGASILLIDDGLQHRQLARDFEIIVVEATDPLGKGEFLPKGWLRETPSRLSCADMIVVNESKRGSTYQEVVNSLRAYTKAPIVWMTPEVQLPDAKKIDVVGIFCGIAHPERFRQAIEGMGIQIVGELFSEDHRLPEKEKLQAFAQKCKESGAQALLCTEKDIVKFSKKWVLSLPVNHVVMNLSIHNGQKEWDECLKIIKEKASAFSKVGKEKDHE